MNLRILPGLQVLVLTLASCGTILNGSRRIVSFSSDPPGAKVLVNGQPLGTTPFQSGVDNRRQQNVEFHLDGYEPRFVVMNTSVGGAWVILDIVPGFLLGIIPLLVDAVTGNWNELDDSHVHAVLEPLKHAP